VEAVYVTQAADSIAGHQELMVKGCCFGLHKLQIFATLEKYRDKCACFAWVMVDRVYLNYGYYG